MSDASKPPLFPKTDERLLGIWKSDRVRTFKEWRWSKRLSAKKKKRVQSLFGKLELTFTRNQLVSALRHRQWESSRRYALVAADESSVAIVHFGKIKIKHDWKYERENLRMAEAAHGSKPEIQHIHFDKIYFWVSLGNGRNREFFRKLPRRK